VRTKYVCGIRIDEVDRKTALMKAKEILLGKDNKFKWITTINPEKCGRAMSNNILKNTINHSVITLPDGIGVLWIGRFYGLLLKHRIPGIEFAWALIQIAYKNNLSIYLYGADAETNNCVRKKLEALMPGIEIAGNMDGYSNWNIVLNDIIRKQPTLLLIAMGGGKQEEFIWRYKDILPVKLAMGIGGSFDVWAGKVERAPRLWQILGIEWLYRIIKEPHRIPRLRYGLKFLSCALKQLLYNK